MKIFNILLVCTLNLLINVTIGILSSLNQMIHENVFSTESQQADNNTVLSRPMSYAVKDDMCTEF